MKAKKVQAQPAVIFDQSEVEVIIDLYTFIIYTSLVFSYLPDKMPPITPSDLNQMLRTVYLARQLDPEIPDEEVKKLLLGINPKVDKILLKTLVGKPKKR